MSDREKKLLEGPRVWRLNRLQYPGWVIAPSSVRRTLWFHTSRWVNPLAAIDSSYSASERLFVFRELNWRLEVALLPLFTNVAEAVEFTLREIDLTPKDSQAVFLPTANGEDIERECVLPAAEVDVSWKELAFALLRFKREERLFEDFDAWVIRLSQMPSLTTDEECRICYEKALLAFGRMDDVAVANALGEWPETSSLRWRVFKASVAAQLGRTDDASSIAHSALVRIQKSVKHPTDSQFLVSLEGWTLMLLRAIHGNFLQPERDRAKDDLLRKNLDRRMRQVERLKCDPWKLVEEVKAFSDWPPPDLRQESESIGFQPRQVSVTQHLGVDLFSKLQPAYEMMRFSEVAPYPPSLCGVNLCKDSLRAAAIWLIPHDSVRTDTLLFHALDADLLKSYLSRHRVAAMAKDRARQIYELAFCGVKQALSSECIANPLPRTPTTLRVERRVSIGVEIVARLAVRLDVENLLELWDFSVALYRSDFIARGQVSHDGLKELFRSLFLCLQEEELQSRFEELVELPIPQTEGFPVLNSYSWPYLVYEFSQRVPRLRDVNPDNWRHQVADLLRKAQSDSNVVKKRALLRLGVLLDYGCLSRKQRDEFAAIFWSDVNEYSLPECAPFARHACLQFPRPSNTNVADKFKAFALDLPDNATPDELNPRIKSWLQATKLGPADNDGTHCRIDWQRDDITKMLRCVQSCWNEIKNTTPDTGFRAFGRSLTGKVSCKDQVEDILLALRNVIVPRITSAAELSIVSRIVKEVQASDYPIGVILPVLGAIDGDFDVEAVARFGLASHDGDEYLSTLMGVRFWSEFAGENLGEGGSFVVPEMPPDVIRELGVIIANRRQPFLDQALLATSVFLRSTTSDLDSSFVSSVLFGLRYLYKELEYRWSDETRGAVAYEQVPICRQYAVRIANCLYEKHGRSDEIVLQWLQSAEHDALPEVRREVTVSLLTNSASIQFPGDSATSPETLLKSLLRKRTRRSDVELVLNLIRKIELDRAEGEEPDIQLAALTISNVAKLMLKSRKTDLYGFFASLHGIVDEIGEPDRIKFFNLALNDDTSEPFATLEWLKEFFSRRSAAKPDVTRRSSPAV